MGVLEAEEDAGLALLLGLADVGRGAHRDHQVAVLADQLLAGGDVVDRGLEAFPDRHRAVGRSQAALAHVFEQFAIPLGDDQTVDDDAVGVHFCWAHLGVPLVRQGLSGAPVCCRRFEPEYPRCDRRPASKTTRVVPKASRRRHGRQRLRRGRAKRERKGFVGWVGTRSLSEAIPIGRDAEAWERWDGPDFAASTARTCRSQLAGDPNITPAPELPARTNDRQQAGSYKKQEGVVSAASRQRGSTPPGR
ncbi:hypothetical protein D3C78_1081070 [compost metagenome]